MKKKIGNIYFEFTDSLFTIELFFISFISSMPGKRREKYGGNTPVNEYSFDMTTRVEKMFYDLRARFIVHATH